MFLSRNKNYDFALEWKGKWLLVDILIRSRKSELSNGFD